MKSGAVAVFGATARVRSKRGAGSGLETNLEMTAVYTVRKGKIFAIEHFWNDAEALTARFSAPRAGFVPAGPASAVDRLRPPGTA